MARRLVQFYAGGRAGSSSYEPKESSTERGAEAKTGGHDSDVRGDRKDGSLNLKRGGRTNDHDADDRKAKGGSIDIKHPGRLHAKLGIAKDKKIGKARLEKADHSKDPAERKEAQFALNMNKRRGGKVKVKVKKKALGGPMGAPGGALSAPIVSNPMEGRMTTGIVGRRPMPVGRRRAMPVLGGGMPPGGMLPPGGRGLG